MKTSHSNRRGFGAREWAGALPGLLVLAVLIVYPLGTLVLQTVLPHLFDVQPTFSPTLQPLQQVFADKANLRAVFNSLEIGLFAAIVATVFGTLTAYGTHVAKGRVKTALDVTVWVVFFTPSYVIAEGWVILLQDGGILANLFGLPNGWSAWFFTRFGLVLAMGLRYFPFVHFAMTQAIQNFGDEYAQAARLLGASPRRIFWRVVLPLMTPALLAGASIAFAEGFGDFGFAAAITPQTHIPLITYQIYSSLSEAPVNYAAAAGLSLLLISVTAATLWLQFWWMRKRDYVTVSTHAKAAPVAPSRVSRLTIGGFVLAGFAFIFPVGATVCASLWKSWTGGLGASNWTFAHYQAVLQVGSDGLAALGRSVGYSFLTALLTMGIGLIVAYRMAFRRSAATKIVNVLTMSTIAVPGVVLAAGFIFAWNGVWLIPIHLVLYGTSTCLAMAYVAGSLPYAIRLQLGAMGQLSPNLVVAGRMLGARDATLLRKIVLPLVSSTAVSTFFMTLTGVMFELPASSLLYPAGEPPFPVAIEAKFNAFEWSQGSALTIVGIILVFGVYALGRYLVGRLQPTATRRAQTALAMPESGSPQESAAQYFPIGFDQEA